MLGHLSQATGICRLVMKAMNSTIIASSQSLSEFIRPHFSRVQEELHIIALNRELQVIGHQCLFRGTVDICPLHPREIFAYLIGVSASQFIMTHNHPTGLALPSKQDLAATKRIQKAAGLMGIPLVDHLILSASSYFSLSDHQLLPKYQSFF